MASEDWTKFVTLNPPNEVKFKIIEEDKDLANPDNVKAQAKIEIINKSKSAILFKVSKYPCFSKNDYFHFIGKNY